MKSYRFHDLKKIIGDEWEGVDGIVLVGFKMEDAGRGLVNVYPVMIQQVTEKDGISRADGGALLIMAGEKIQGDTT